MFSKNNLCRSTFIALRNTEKHEHCRIVQMEVPDSCLEIIVCTIIGKVKTLIVIAEVSLVFIFVCLVLDRVLVLPIAIDYNYDNWWGSWNLNTLMGYKFLVLVPLVMPMENGNSNFACDFISRVWSWLEPGSNQTAGNGLNDEKFEEKLFSHTSLASDGTSSNLCLEVGTIGDR